MLRRKNVLLLACLVLLGVALFAILLAGCGSGDDTSTTVAPATTAGGQTDTTATAGKAYKITYVSWSQSSVKSTQQLAAMQAVAAKNGWEVAVMDAQGMPDKLVPLIQNAVETGPDVIITEVFPPSQIAAAAQAAKTKGIPIISLGGGLGEGVEAFWDDGVPFGEAVAKTVLEMVGDHGDILLLGFSPGAPATGRENGFKAALEAAGAKFNIDRQEVPVPGEVEGGLKFAQAWLTSHPKGGGPYVIFGTWDEPAIGAISALRQMGRTDVYVFGVDGSPQGFQAIKDGTMTGTLWSDPQSVGTAAMEAIPQVIANGVSGEKTIHELETFTMVTKDNVDQIIKDHPYVMGSGQ
jgi:ribose transport system substrate-binding protein